MSRKIIIIEDDDTDYDWSYLTWPPRPVKRQNDSNSSNPGYYGSDPCKDCPNNPKNNPHASGFCHCALPAMRNTFY